MGATVTTGKKVYAYADASGQPVYVLCEETYEKNCYPHTPHWSVIAFGRIETVMQRVFSYAAATCGGMLQGRGGWITPTDYVAGWLQEMGAPHAFTDEKTVLVVKANSYGRVIDEEHASQACATLHAQGRADLAGSLARGDSITLQYRDDAAVLCALAMVVPPWRLLGDFDVVGYADSKNMALAYRPETAKTSPHVPLPGLFRMRPKGDTQGLKNIVVSQNGRPVIGEWEYAVREAWVHDYGPHELSHPGHFPRQYRDLVKHLDNLPLLPADTIIQIDPDKARSAWANNAKRMAADLGGQVITFGDMTADLPRFGEIARYSEAVTLVLPENTESHQPEICGQIGFSGRRITKTRSTKCPR